MKILILGAMGMLGRALVEEFSASHEVAAWDRTEVDITDKNQVGEKIKILHPDIVINAAAYNNVDEAEKEDRELAMKVNGEAVGYLAEVSAGVGAIFVHYSTDYIFRGDKAGGYKEDDEPEPVSWYGKTKYEGEKQITNYKLQITNKIQNPNIKYYLIRTSRLFGPGGIGEGAKKSFVDKMLELGRTWCHSHKACPRAASGSGNPDVGLDVVDEELSSPSYVNDLAEATFKLIESKAPWGIYHRTNFGSCTWYGWARKIFELANLPVKLNPVPASRFPRPAIRPKHSILLNTKLPAMRSWEEALAEYLNF